MNREKKYILVSTLETQKEFGHEVEKISTSTDVEKAIRLIARFNLNKVKYLSSTQARMNSIKLLIVRENGQDVEVCFCDSKKTAEINSMNKRALESIYIIKD